MKVRYLLITIFLFFFFATVCPNADACHKRIVVYNTLDWVKQFSTKEATYVILKEFDLKGKTLTIPDNSNLLFNGGKIKNGSIQGRNTSIEAKKACVFENITLLGTWKNKTVYSEWLDFVEGQRVDNVRNFRNLMLLCKSDVMTHLYMQIGVFYCSVLTGTSNIIVPSNVYWHNSATICQLPTESPKYGFILLYRSNNVTIDGGEFVGDVQSHLGKEGEWGHGIKLAGASKVVLRNLTCREFWGDGIDLIEAEYVGSINAGVGICDNITIDNVKCLYNRRQGMSIEAAQNVIVKDSEFAYTGGYLMTPPGCGVDIEPWCRNEKKIENIRFEDCYIHDNNPQRDFSVEPNCQYNGRKKNLEELPINKVVVNKCRMGSLFIHGANTVSFNNCFVDDITRYDNGYNIRMNRCTIKRRTGINSTLGLTMTKCSE